MNTTGLELAIARVISGKTAKQVAQTAGIHRSNLSRIEKGRIVPTTDELARLRRAAGWTPQVSFFVRMLHESSTIDTACSSVGSPQSAQEGQESPSELPQVS